MTDAAAANTVTPSNEDEGYRQELIDRANILGIKFHPNAGNDTIAAKIAAKLKEEPKTDNGQADNGKTDEPEKVTTNGPGAPAPNPMIERVPTKKEKELHPAKRLVRVIITCNDPQKADQSGDIVSVSNGEVGNMRFYFHFNKPWHVPQIILDTIKESKLFLHSSRKDGKEIVQREVPRYNIQELPPLTEKERGRIEAKQAAALATED